MLGETIGNFKIVRKLGRGGMGEVWLGEQQSLGTRVAVKTLLEAFPPESEDVQRFFNEARAVSRIQHAGITKIFDSGILPDGRAYLVMEFLDGESLAHRIARGEVSRGALCDIARQIASVLDATHSAGITHRDLKPENVFLIPDREQPRGERVKVLDFGVAKLTGTLAPGSPRTFGTLGTPMYMAPEQWGDASQVDWRADLYSLGCVVFEMAAGKPPFPCKTVAEACARHLNDVPPLASSLAPGLPRELDRLIAQLLAKKPEDRPRSMRDVARAFEQLAGAIGIAGTTATLPIGGDAGHVLPPNADVLATVTAGEARALPTERRRAGLILGVGVGLAVAGAGAAAGMLWLRSKDPPATAPAVHPIVSEILLDAAGAAPPAAPPDAGELRDKLLAVAGATPDAGVAIAKTERTDRTERSATVTHAPPARPVHAPAAEPVHAPPAEPVHAPPAELPDRLSKDQIAKGLLSAEAALDACMVEHHVTEKVILALRVEPSGRVSSAAPQGALAGTPYAACVFAALRVVTFPATRTAMSITVPVTPP